MLKLVYRKYKVDTYKGKKRKQVGSLKSSKLLRGQ